jgi:hypothetical protein
MLKLKYPALSTALISTCLLSTALVANGYAGACKTDKCKPASIADVKALIKKNLAPVPPDPALFNPVSIVASRQCDLAPNSNASSTDYDLTTDNISITYVKNAANTTFPNTYTITGCTPPTTGTIKMYTDRTSATAPNRTTTITYTSPAAFPLAVGDTGSPLTTLVMDISAVSPINTAPVTGVSASLESFTMPCTVQDVTEGVDFPVYVTVPYCD